MAGFDSASRRRVLKTTGAATLGMYGLAGCLGGDSTDDMYELNIAGASEGSGSFQIASALQAQIREHLPDIDARVQTTGGSVANMERMALGDFNAGQGNTYRYEEVVDGIEDREYRPLQGTQTTAAHLYMCAVEGSGIETYDDLTNDGVSVWPYEAGFTSFDMARDWLTEAGIWDDIPEIVNVSTANIVGAIQEGRVDAFMPTAVSFQTLVGWARELEALDIEFDVIQMESHHIDAIENVGLPHVEIESYGWDTKDFGTIDTWGLTGAFWYTPDVPDDVVYDVTELFYEQSEAMQEAVPIILPYDEDQEYMIGQLLSNEQVEVHPGARQYYEDAGMWPLPTDR